MRDRGCNQGFKALASSKRKRVCLLPGCRVRPHMHALPRVNVVRHVFAQPYLTHGVVKVVIAVGKHIDFGSHNFSQLNTRRWRGPVVFFTQHQYQCGAGFVAGSQC